MRRRFVTAAGIVVASTLGLIYGATVVRQDPVYKPTVTTVPVVSGTPAVGEPLTCDPGGWSRNPTVYNIAWKNQAGTFKGAGSPYLVAAADEGDSLSCHVTAGNLAGTGQASSTLVGPVPEVNDLLIVTDTFTDANDTSLDDHIGEYGADWTKHPSFARDSFITDNRLRGDGDTGRANYYASGEPDDADYDVEAELRWVTTVPSDQVGIWGRFSPTTHTGYRVVWFQGGGPHGWELSKWVSTTKTSLASYSEDPPNGAVRNVRMEFRGDQIKVYIQNILRMSVTDSSITTAGRVGIQTRFATAAAGVHIDSVYAAHPSSTPPPPAVQCADGIDNADPEDVLVDLADPGCVDSADDDETDPPPATHECNDGIDNGDPEDVLFDYPADPGCATAIDDDETDPPACSDGIDNGDPEDALADFPLDPGCTGPLDTDETDPPPPPPPTTEVANVWVHALSTGSCARFVAPAEYDAALACPENISAGWNITASNDRMMIRGGTYTGVQRMDYRAGITGGVIAPSNGKVNSTGPWCLGRRTTACGTTNARSPTDLTIDADGGSGDFVWRSFYASTFGDDVRPERITIRGGHTGYMNLGQMSNSTIDGTVIGPSFNSESGIVLGFGANVVGENMTLRNLVVRDHQNECRYYEADTVDQIGVLPEVCPDTTLALPASPGATTLTLTDAEGWGCAGCITEGSGRYEEMLLDVTRESKRVTAVNGNVITLASPISGTYAAGTRIWAGNSTHVDNIDIRGMMGTLLIENTRVYNCGSQCIFLGDGPNGVFAGSTCPIATVACFEDVILRNSMIDACESCGPASALNIKQATNDPEWAPGSSILVEHVSATSGFNSFQGTSDTAAYSVETIVFRNNLGTWHGSCTFALTKGADSISFDNNGFQHTDGGAACSVDEDAITSVEAEFVSANDNTAPFTPDLSLAPGADAIDCGDPVTFSLTDLFGATRPLGAAPDCGAHEKS